MAASAGGDDGTARLWDVESGKEIFRHRAQGAVDFRFRNRTLAKRLDRGKCIPSLDCRIPDQRGDATFITMMVSAPRGHFQAPLAGPAELGGIRILVYMNLLDACNR